MSKLAFLVYGLFSSIVKVPILVLPLLNECYFKKVILCLFSPQMKGCIKVLKDQPPNSVEGLLNALRYVYEPKHGRTIFVQCLNST